MRENNSNYKWCILLLVVLTDMFVIAIPQMGMSVLAREIADDLGLDLVQVGVIWGAGALLGVFTGLFGGMIGDKVGPKRVLIVTSLLGGLLGMARGWAGGFASMTVIMILIGAIVPIVLINSIKVIGQWFPPQQLGVANGVQAMGMALGFMLGSLFSATTLSPWLGGWRNVLIAYGVIGALFSVAWFFTRTGMSATQTAGAAPFLRLSLRHVTRLKNVWLLGFGLFGIGGAIQGTLGFLPLYLRGVGWLPIYADGALSVFHVVSMTFVLPMAMLSDRLGVRKPFLLGTGLLIACGFGLLGFVDGEFVWVAVILSGAMRDAFMAIFLTMIIETDQVGPVYAGTGTGFAFAVSGIGNVVAPPIGNSLAIFWPGAPFAFWSMLAVAGVICLALVKEGSRAPEKVDLKSSKAQVGMAK
jgi:MFS family permease